MTSANGYAKGLVVVRRQAEGPRKGKKPRRPAWTLHVEDCVYITRYASAGKAMPAPAEPWPNTFECTTCKPRSPHRLTHNYDAVTETHTYACRCGHVASGSNAEAARAKSRRFHSRMERESAA